MIARGMVRAGSRTLPTGVVAFSKPVSAKKVEGGGGGEIGKSHRRRAPAARSAPPPTPRRAKIRITAASGSSLIATVRIDMPARGARAERVDRGEQDDARDRDRNDEAGPGESRADPGQGRSAGDRDRRLRRPVGDPEGPGDEESGGAAPIRARYWPGCRRRRAWSRRASAKAMHKAPTLLSTQPSDRVGAERRERDGEHEDAGADHRPDDQGAGHPDADPLVGRAPHGGGVARNARRGNRAGRRAGLVRAGLCETSSAESPPPRGGGLGGGVGRSRPLSNRRTPSPDPSPPGRGEWKGR